MKRIDEAAAGATGRFAFDPGFSQAVIAWQRSHGRHTLPWQDTRDPYRVWLSEIMLQQTQVAAVVPYYLRFLASFPDVATLAAAPQDQVMAHWSGLGYYSRARNLHRCAQRVMTEHGGIFPSDPSLLAELPGIGRSTAAAIAAFSYGARAAILDGNVKRVFCRAFGVEGFPGVKAVENLLWERAQALLPEQGIEAYTQGLMDLGATVCTRSKPACNRCPLAQRCIALASGRVHLLPAPKPAKATPQRETVMLVIEAGDQVLLEQRPDSGIWGGLLSLPELAPDDDFDAALAQAVLRFGELAEAGAGARAGAEALQPFTHVFTHFKLRITPYRIRLARRHAFAGEARHIWRAQTDLVDAALPAPVKKLLLGLYRSDTLLA
jgi:A/G-specific adenine glycosylase